MQARFGERFFSIVTRKNYLLHPTSSGFESRATHIENKKDQSEFLTWTDFIIQNFGLVNLDIWIANLWADVVDIGI